VGRKGKVGMKTLREIIFTLVGCCLLVGIVMVVWVHELDTPIVHQDSITREVVRVITCDGVRHGPEYFDQVKDHDYSVVLVRPKVMDGPVE
jgi:hypothetical protein